MQEETPTSTHDWATAQIDTVNLVLAAVGVDTRVSPDVKTLLTPSALAESIRTFLPNNEVIVTSSASRRLLAVNKEGDDWIVGNLNGAPIASASWPEWFFRNVLLRRSDACVSSASIPPPVLDRMRRPRILLASLYHPEIFPFARFPLGISDLARAARDELCARVDLLDMQTGCTTSDVVSAALGGHYDLVGVSATFGQHDQQQAILETLFSSASDTVVMAGGSLTARNEASLMAQYPKLIISRAAGESTVQDMVRYLRGDLSFGSVRGISYRAEPGLPAHPRIRRTPVARRADTGFTPELDLLGPILDRRGAAQMETSRGCTNACSFCPRGHKGAWIGPSPNWDFRWVVGAIASVADSYSDLEKIIYLVDEEFIGSGGSKRAIEIASVLQRAGFQWETSCRIDQVVDGRENEAWHLERAELWRRLKHEGLRRCLFGVESGVTSVLDRFAKETTASQNATAIRTLSALGVPTRFTYITFDPLMSLEELRQTAAFQGRTDLILRSCDDMSVADIVAGVNDADFVREHSAHRPLYHDIPYMLVSMECLSGAAYTKRVQAAGLAVTSQSEMGRLNSRYLDPRIGHVSLHAQMWIDRNFSFDYALKSLEKTANAETYSRLHRVRRLMKTSAFAVLGAMVIAAEECDVNDADSMPPRLLRTLEQEMDALRRVLQGEISELMGALPQGVGSALNPYYLEWVKPKPWRLLHDRD